MHKSLLLMSCLALFLGLVAEAPAQDAAVQAIIEKAIKAHGEKFISKPVMAKTKGSLDILGGLNFTQEVTAQLPNQYKEVMELEVNGQKVTVKTVFDGEQGWLNVNGQEQKLDDKILTELKEAGNLMRLSRLSTLLSNKDKAFELSPLGEMKADSKTIVGIKVATKGFRDVSLYFDKDTGLMYKSERRVVDPMTQMELTEERVIQEYQEQDGSKYPKKVLVNRDGKKFMEAEVIELKYLDKLDNSEFGKP